MENKCGIFVVKRLHFSNILDWIWTWTLHLKKIWTVWSWTEFLKIRTGSGSQNMTAGLPGWAFWSQISEIWSQTTLAGFKIFVWPFGSLWTFSRIYWPLARIKSDQPGRDEHWTGLGLDWIRTIANFVEFGLDPGCKSFQNLGSGPDLDWVNGKEMRHFVVKRLHFSNTLDFIWTWTLHLKNILDCGLTWTGFFKIRTGSGSQNRTVRSSL